MAKWKGWKLFWEIKNMKSLGLNKSQATRNLGIDYGTVTKYWDMSLEEFEEILQERSNRGKKLDKYKDEIVSWIRDYPDLSAAQVMDWLEEKYKVIGCGERCVRDFMSTLRKELNIQKVKKIRQHEAVDELPMGYQAQVDFGQIWLVTEYDRRIKLYCFAMVLSHSRYKFVYWMDRPFTTKDFVYAHDKAFEYFGGMPKEIVYDQDRLIAVDENYGDIIFTDEFQKYMDFSKFKIYLCRGFDPQSKGKIEAVVKYVKYNFARYRKFKDITSFNEACLAWLDRTGNGKVHGTTKKIPKEVFALEKEHLLSAPNYIKKENSTDSSVTYVVRKDNTVLYKQNRYQLPKGTYAPGKRVGFKDNGSSISFVDLETGMLLVTYRRCTERGKLIKLSRPERDLKTSLNEIYQETLQLLGADDNAQKFLQQVRESKPRYIRDQLGLIRKAAVENPESIVKQALKYCIKRNLYSATFFNDTVIFMLDKSISSEKKSRPITSHIPQKYRDIKTEQRDTSEYTRAMEG